MKTRKLHSLIVLGPMLLGLVIVEDAVAGSPSSGPLAVASISIQGTNLLLSASIPAGVEKVLLETRATNNVPWEAKGPVSVPPDGGRLTFKLAKPSRSAYFRLRGGKASAAESMTSAESAYMVIAPLGGTGAASTGDAVLEIRATIDGSDQITVSRTGAVWEHADWNWPLSSISANGVEWNPRLKNHLAAPGAADLVPEAFSLSDATVEVVRGRGSVILENADDAVRVRLDDTQEGASEYDVKVHFRPASSK
jgi:hypothetical protein